VNEIVKPRCPMAGKTGTIRRGAPIEPTDAPSEISTIALLEWGAKLR